ncbi:hypothetical protein AKO1_005431 [Acrasis kona]|uniref:Uncharacterized protein n=1 Tax=Acrasis kona TaxID=1008807 RepID=A0AAW2ZMH5_9EUKA
MQKFLMTTTDGRDTFWSLVRLYQEVLSRSPSSINVLIAESLLSSFGNILCGGQNVDKLLQYPVLDSGKSVILKFVSSVIDKNPIKKIDEQKVEAICYLILNSLRYHGEHSQVQTIQEVLHIIESLYDSIYKCHLFPGILSSLLEVISIQDSKYCQQLGLSLHLMQTEHMSKRYITKGALELALDMGLLNYMNSLLLKMHFDREQFNNVAVAIMFLSCVNGRVRNIVENELLSNYKGLKADFGVVIDNHSGIEGFIGLWNQQCCI